MATTPLENSVSRRRDSAADEAMEQAPAWLTLEDEPVRADLLSLDQLRAHARDLAERHQITAKRANRLLPRLDENANVLEETYRMLARACSRGDTISPAAVWLLDNYYLIQEQIRMARRHLPRKYSMELPRLAGGINDGLPRVYHLALELMTRVDGEIDQESLHAFIGEYQKTTVLTLGELWAIPTMLRFALVENLRGVCIRVARQQHDRQLGDWWADRVLGVSRGSFEELRQTAEDLSAQVLVPNAAFVARFLQRLNGHATKGDMAVQWLTKTVAEQGQTIDGLVHLDSQNQAADQLSMGNCITSLRGLRALDWKEFVESQSAVERVLRQDPAGFYSRMDFTSRDRCRHVVETLAKGSRLAEEKVARLAIKHAQRASKTRRGDVAPGDGSERERRQHVGYYLVDKGRLALEDQIGYRPNWKERVARLARRAPLGGYLGAITLLWLLVNAGVGMTTWNLAALGVIAPATAVLLSLAFAGAAGQFAVSVVNWLCTLLVPPRVVMRLDFSRGIPAGCRTLVAVPTMLTSEKAVRALVGQLEVRYLANRDDNLLFSLLTDFPDAEQETLPQDEKLLALIRNEIARLNRRYCDGRPSAFFFLHRPRKWNPREDVWMGEERKRGKLESLNRLIRSGDATAFSVTMGDLDQLSSVRYVITLDTDTGLPHGAARELVGCMAHPLNRPRIDPRKRTVVDGYGILQPRVATTIPDANRSRYSRLFVVDAGIDPYTRQTSDVYHDLFGEGSFIGKGIYDVETFAAVLDGRFPKNRVLSHDLIEGCYARSGLVTDVELFEGFPSRVLADMSRRHRWIRGDWQIAAWLLRRVVSVEGITRNPLSRLSRWKVLDNLRRSLTPLFLLGFVVLGCAAVPGLAWFWLLAALALVFGPTVVSCIPGLLKKTEDKPWKLHFGDQATCCLKAIVREGIQWCFLPYTVHCHLDAIVRALYRLGVSRKRLLEWTTASEAEARSEGGCRDHYEVMWACAVTSLALAAWLAIVWPTALVFLGPSLLAWLAGPAIAWWISRPRDAKPVVLREAEKSQMRRWARQTWHYFDTHVQEQDHWLAPDNVQERPGWTIASRTSPTNIGMGLLADLAAFDLGHLSATRMLDRVGRTLNTLEQLDNFRGHFFNWYCTRTLKPCEPRYVSTVDSGNLWGSLVVLRAGLEEARDRPLTHPRLCDGLQDTLAAIAWLRSSTNSTRRRNEFDVRLAKACDACAATIGRASDACRFLQRLRARAEDLADAIPADSPELREWTEALIRQCAAAYEDIAQFAFWTDATAAPWSAYAGLTLDERRALRELRAWIESLDSRATLREVTEAASRLAERIAPLADALTGNRDAAGNGLAELRTRLCALQAGADQAAAAARDQSHRISVLMDLCQQRSAMDFRFLFDRKRKVMAIGFNVSEHRRDNSYYDMLASESRLASFLAVSHGQLPHEHWFALGRLVALADGEPVLLSWAGSMFEYLMPALIMPAYPHTLLETTCRAAVRRQIRYARRLGVPWGISESCYHQTDAALAYQYRAFGVPGLGLQRGLGDDLVIAPYASALAAIVAPREACENLKRLEQLGYLSRYGFYDAIDHTSRRLASDDQPVPCRAVMAHHSGMSLLAFACVLLDDPMQRRFMNNPLCKAHDLLLQERVPQDVRPVNPELLDSGLPLSNAAPAGRPAYRVFNTPHTTTPEVHVLSNGRYHTVLTASGCGASCSGLAGSFSTRGMQDQFGQFCYLRDLETRRFWSNTYDPTRREPSKYQAVFSQGMVEYRVESEDIDTRTRVSVSPEDDVEVRQLTLTNLARTERKIELTTCANLVVGSLGLKGVGAATDDQAFETECIPQTEAILCRRRPLSSDETNPWMFHLLSVQSDRKTAVRFETRRERFVGPMRTLQCPGALESVDSLSGTPGDATDPLLCVRQAVTLASEESVVAHIITGIAETRADALAVIERYRDPRLASRVFDLSRAHSQLVLQHLRITEADAQLYGHLASALIYPDPRYRAESGLVAHGLPNLDLHEQLDYHGDRPIVLVQCSSADHRRLVEQILAAHSYWRGKGLESDLVLWVEPEGGDAQKIYTRILELVGSSPSVALFNRPGGVFVVRADECAAHYFPALRALARICLHDDGGPLEAQVNWAEPAAPENPENGAPRPPARHSALDATQHRNGTASNRSVAEASHVPSG